MYFSGAYTSQLDDSIRSPEDAPLVALGYLVTVVTM